MKSGSTLVFVKSVIPGFVQTNAFTTHCFKHTAVQQCASKRGCMRVPQEAMEEGCGVRSGPFVELLVLLLLLLQTRLCTYFPYSMHHGRWPLAVWR